MRISLIQLGIKWEDREANYRSAERLIRAAAKSGADLVCLPELFSTGVTLDSERFAETANGPTCGFLMEQARENGIHLMGSYIEENRGKLPLNASATYDPRGRLAAKYHKAHLFTHGGEDTGYSLGAPKVTTFKACGFTVCPLICYDLRFPEAFIAGLEKGANLFVIQANWPNPRRMHWESLLQARAIECQSYVAGVNQVGKSLRNTFFGASKIVSPKGDIIKAAGRGQQTVSAQISMEELRETRKKYPFLRERRPIA